MTGIIHEREVNLISEIIQEHEQQVPLIFRQGDLYQLFGLNLPPSWQKNMDTIQTIDSKYSLETFEHICLGHGNKDFEIRIETDAETNLITGEGVESNGKASKVYLDESGNYLGYNIKDLDLAIIYKEFIARYLEVITDLKYPYIFKAFHSNREYGSTDLAIPIEIMDRQGPVTDEDEQTWFYGEKVLSIADQFKITPNNVRVEYDDKGILKGVWTRSDTATYYERHWGDRQFSPHNVDFEHHAAFLHAVVATFINGLGVKVSES